MARKSRVRTSWLAAFLTVAVAATTGCNAPVDPARERERAAHVAPGDSPDQRWGTAVGAGHVDGKNGNTTIPQSMRGRYPLQKLSQKPVQRNKASVATPPKRSAQGFD